MNDHLNAEDREIVEKFERGELRRAAGAEGEVEAPPSAARSTFKKTRRVHLRVTERDFNLAHARACEEGIPYQAVLSSVIHNYLSGRLSKNIPPPEPHLRLDELPAPRMAGASLVRRADIAILEARRRSIGIVCLPAAATGIRPPPGGWFPRES